MARMTSYQNQMEVLKEQRDSLLIKAATVIASAMVEMGKQGVSSTKAVKNDLDNMLKGFSDEEKVAILVEATSKFIVNM